MMMTERFRPINDAKALLAAIEGARKFLEKRLEAHEEGRWQVRQQLDV